MQCNATQCNVTVHQHANQFPQFPQIHRVQTLFVFRILVYLSPNRRGVCAMSEQREELEERERLTKRQKKNQRWLSKSEVAARFGVCSKSVERWGKLNGKFPAGRQLPNTRWVWS